MASIHYEPKLVAILSIPFFLSCIFVSSTGMVAALDPALLVSEGNALLESGWWSDYSNITSNRCKNWHGIVCDRAGSITEMSPPSEFLKVGNKFGKMNFSCFPNLLSVSTWPTMSSMGTSHLKFLSFHNSDTSTCPQITYQLQWPDSFGTLSFGQFNAFTYGSQFSRRCPPYRNREHEKSREFGRELQ
ncbi:hypothetical protein OIU74_009838 [Salix koriyanagi]|uniref:Leucine-rich repeat-containing N-terminal plant-type domain-containing protein n=1 Tax=Salix koriyanagi TaxID=2511006 RepID=A0A9Q0QLC0_9ROSI|nr:hypothetical protein OIU74_009838 [Salix koriyanagi]